MKWFLVIFGVWMPFAVWGTITYVWGLPSPIVWILLVSFLMYGTYSHNH